jgi:malate synthase
VAKRQTSRSKKARRAVRAATKKSASATKARGGSLPAKSTKTSGRAAPRSGAARKTAGRPGPVGQSFVRSGLGPGFMFTLKRVAQRIVGGPQAADQPETSALAVAGVTLKGRKQPRQDDVLTEAALHFLADLHRKFDADRKALLAARGERQRRFDAGELPDFLPETRIVREGDWTVAPIPQDLLDRRVEITGPVDRKMIVNALNSGANVFMADFEDANAPTWANNIEGQINLKDYWHGALDFTDEASGKRYAVSSKPAVLIVRPRGWHLLEEHMMVDGDPIAGALFDFGLYAFHNSRAMREKGTAPYFYLPKLESHQEARLWNSVFVFAQQMLGLPQGTMKATVLIETLPAAFEMDEILWELRDHITGLNAGRWDYIFSFIKKFAKNPNYVLPDRNQVVMGKAFLGAYAALLVKTCHRRRAFAMGGMAAQIPVKNNKAANDKAFAKVRADKEREVREGHDGTWVAHPALVPVAKGVFDRLMKGKNQLDKKGADIHVTRDALLEIHEGTKTEDGFRLNIRVGVQYIEAWLGGRGAVPIYNLMEDAATAEISRAQIWQWLRYGVTLDTGVKATPAFFDRALKQEMARVKREVGAAAYRKGRFPDAIKLFRKLSLSKDFVEFLTIPAYRLIN